MRIWLERDKVAANNLNGSEVLAACAPRTPFTSSTPIGVDEEKLRVSARLEWRMVSYEIRLDGSNRGLFGRRTRSAMTSSGSRSRRNASLLSGAASSASRTRDRRRCSRSASIAITSCNRHIGSFWDKN
jgi:hypothetical protein